MANYTISGQLVDIHQQRIYGAEIKISGEQIISIEEIATAPDRYILPGFIDAHVHIESSMLVPSAFAQMAVVHGTIATVSDPHEIANVCGVEGIQYMIANSKQTPFKIFFGAPSCVPATSFETAGANIDSDAIKELLASSDIWYLSEMMNYPGVLYKDAEVLAKIAAAKAAGKPVDGHAPGLKGEDATNYAAAGISTDHECFTLDEALHKINAGMHILIREGSAAKNFEALAPLLKLHPEKVMFCSDDKHPDDLAIHHINNLVKRALVKGYDLYDVLRAACLNPVNHYKLPVGLLRENDPADFIVIDSLSHFTILQTYINGKLVADKGKSLLPTIPAAIINNFSAQLRTAEDFACKAISNTNKIRVIEAVEGQLITTELHAIPKIENGCIVSDIENDILKLVVINRYTPNAEPAIAFIKNIGLKMGALASTVAHDCHNIIAVGADDISLAAAVNVLINSKGGIAVAMNETDVYHLPLPVGGIMTTEDGYTVATQYASLNEKAKQIGTKLHAPFMTLSFMALLVIPALKLSDKGLFNGQTFEFTSVAIA